jgi:hypothetical protein
MKTTLFILSLCFSLTVFAQSTLSDRNIQFGFSLSPEFNDLKVSNLVGQESVAPKMGLSAGLNVAFHLSNKISLRTGLGYGFKHYNHTHAGLIFGTDLNPITGVNTTSAIESKVSFSEFQINDPLRPSVEPESYTDIPPNCRIGVSVFKITLLVPTLTADAVMFCNDELPCTIKSFAM